MIRGFDDTRTESIFQRDRVKGTPVHLQQATLRKLVILDAAETLADLRVPPGNRLEKLAGKRQGQYSVRVNDQWRIRFRWLEGEAHDVEFVDHH